MSILSIDVGIRHLSWVVLNHNFNNTTNEIDISIDILKDISISMENSMEIKEQQQYNKILWDIVDITPNQYNLLCNCSIDKKLNCKKTLKYYIINDNVNENINIINDNVNENININIINKNKVEFYCDNITKLNNKYSSISNCIICNKKCRNLFYSLDENNEIKFYCKKHIQKNTYHKVEKCNCINYIKNQSKIENICNKQAICYNNVSNQYYCKIHKNNITNTKNIKIIDRNKLQIEEIFKSMVEKLDKILYLWKNVKIVLIEKQPPKNPRMKSIMSSLQSYFIIRGTIDDTPLKIDISNIHLINAKNKLNVYELNKKYPKVDYKAELTKEGKKRKNEDYIRRKLLSIKYTENILNLMDNKIFYNYFIENPSKKDDYADCYLQGRFFIEYVLSKNTINQHNQWINFNDINIQEIPKRFCFSDKVMSKKKILNLMSLKYILNKYPFTIENFETHKYKNQIINSMNKFFGSIDFYFSLTN